MKKLLKNKKGFTLIELIVVIAILAILAAILIPSIMNYISEATEAKNTANARAAYTEAALEVATDNETAIDPLNTWGYADSEVCENTSDTDLTSLTIENFSCEIDGKDYALANDFVGS